jgi:hypothetical protein
MHVLHHVDIAENGDDADGGYNQVDEGAEWVFRYVDDQRAEEAESVTQDDDHECLQMLK